MRRLLTTVSAAALAVPLLLLGSPPAQATQVTTLWLVNAANGTRISALTDYQTLDLAFLPSTLSVEAVVDGSTESVRFTLEGVNHTENTPPYTLAAETNGAINPVPRLHQAGWVTVQAKPYSQNHLAGTAGATVTRHLYLRQPDFVVSNPADLHDSSVGNGGCRGTARTACTLRAAIEEANALPGRQTISIDGRVGPYLLNLGQLRITQDVALYGFQRPVVDAHGASRVLYVSGTAADNLLVDIDNLDLANGDVGTLDRGGVLRVDYALLQLSNSIVRGGHANFGGGIYLQTDGDLTLTRSTIRDNSAGHPASFGGGGVTQRGGGISSLAGNVTIEASSIVDNEAVRGGGISNLGGRLTIDNSSVLDNGAASQGGGIENVDQAEPAVLNVSFSTITGNQSGLSGGDPADKRTGGGIWNNGWAFLASSVLAENTGPFASSNPNYSPDCYSPVQYDFKSYRNNLVGILSPTCSLGDYSWGGLQFFQSGTPAAPLDPRLLARVGSNPAYRLPNTTSPALDAAASQSASLFPCPATDIRGRTRPVGPGCDIGSTERQ